MKPDTKTWVYRFTNRKDAKKFADKAKEDVTRCPATGANKDGYFKFQVVTVGYVRR